MTPHPVAISMMFCDYVIIEQHTQKPSGIGMFTGLKMAAFPATAPPFSVLAFLTEAVGEGIMEMAVARLDTAEIIYSHRGIVRFAGVLDETKYHLRLNGLVLPAPGVYQFTLLVDGQWVAHRILRVSQR